ncbi:hypothetical protein ACIBCO_40675 [Streptomyces violascens]|uniref:hypothetical protein n=1 Tax=Streptomyces violascens TaxID=67381 RepID=UPI00379D0E7D
MNDDLVAVCDVCLGEIADGGGVLEVDAARADRALRASSQGRRGPDALFHLTPGEVGGPSPRLP